MDIKKYLTASNYTIAALAVLLIAAGAFLVVSATNNAAYAKAYDAQSLKYHSAENKVEIQQSKIETLQQDKNLLKEQVSNLYTQEDLDKAVSDAKAAQKKVDGTPKVVTKTVQAPLPDWAQKAQECLNRGGSYISADITVSDFDGTDVSCYQG